MRRHRALAALLAVALCALAAPAASARIPPPPLLSAPAAAVLESSTQTPLFGRAAGQRRLIASTTKIMTALVAVSSAPLDRVCTAPPYAAGPLEVVIHLRAGERMRLSDLLRAMLLPSANDAAATVAACVGSRAAFVARMNARARQLGLRQTHFATPVGLDEAGNYSTADDLARLAIAARGNAFLRQTMGLRRAVLRSGDHVRVVVNRNVLVQDVPWVNGVKTGHTNVAGYILAASGTRHGTTLVATVLGDPTEAAAAADALALLKWAFASFRFVVPVRRGAVYARPAVKLRPGQHVDVVAARSVRVALARDARVRLVVDVPRQLAGPIPARAIVGSVAVQESGHALDRVPLVVRTAVPKVGLLEQLGRRLDGPGSLIAIVALLGGAVVVFARARGARRRRERRRADMETA